MDTAALTALRQEIAGEVVLPGDDSYERLRNVFVHPGSPDVVVRCRDAADVRTALRFARDAGLTVSVRSGGHSNAGFSTDEGGLVVDLSLIDGVEIVDPARNVVRIGTGARWGRVAAALADHGLAISSGDTSTVGVGGLLLGGGIGWMVRRDGLALDNVVGAEVVTADGRVLRASADDNPDLFWAIRGGGGNFGVVTTFDVVARPDSGVHFGAVTYPAEDAVAVVRNWSRAMRTAPDEVTSTVALYPGFGDAPPPVIITVCYAGDDPAAAAAAVDPLLRLGEPIENTIRPMPYAGVLEDPSDLPPGWIPRVKSAFAPVCGDGFVETLITGARTFDTLFVELRSLGGAVGRVPRDATAFAHRANEVLLTTVLLGAVEDTRPQEPAFQAFWATLAEHTEGAYSNFLSQVDEDDVAAVYPPETLARLSGVKTVYDPGNVFSRNPNVTPVREPISATS
ncbi:FAD-binding oxidoreductase [Microbispora sp. ATCC PTA-5024]|uniref:FAD-binding oxidoreductase n=1 Tax=Microbispora sp. ATCC PTA-5024 TaxID=316330 RepID=UPI0003DB976F|nr:FAD-binding oxidoreductase [Microbispora sp. ATCC PTA-5024]ETK37174.1 FAD-linked oxidase [Microbispora sp. ATCC PTA-5024]